jgi:hypothetical protein
MDQPALDNNQMMAIYHAGWQATKVRGLFWFALAVCLGCLYWGYDLSQTYGLSPGDGGVLRPLAQRVTWGGFVALFGLSFFTGMFVYAWNYIRQVWLNQATQQVVFETVRLWGNARFSVAPQDILGSRYHAGDLETPTHTVNAPYFLVRLRGRKLPLILDGQGKFLKPGLAARLMDL